MKERPTAPWFTDPGHRKTITIFDVCIDCPHVHCNDLKDKEHPTCTHPALEPPGEELTGPGTALSFFKFLRRPSWCPLRGPSCALHDRGHGMAPCTCHNKTSWRWACISCSVTISPGEPEVVNGVAVCPDCGKELERWT